MPANDRKSAAPRRRKTQAGAAPERASTPKLTPPTPADAHAHDSRLKSLARGVQSLTNSMLGMADTATDLTMALAKSRLKKPAQRAAIERAGALMHDLRQAAGLTVNDLGTALGLDEPGKVALIESGTIAMPFELILRAAAVLGRNDPLTFVMQFTRAYNPDLWKALESLGVGQLVVQGAREREFANIYRAHEGGRRLSDAEFADALAFVNSSWELALAFRRPRPAKTAPAAKGPRAPDEAV